MWAVQLSLVLLLASNCKADGPFWISAELDAINWREGCLTTALCSQPRFQLVKDLLPVSERVSVNWPISEHFVKESVKPFVSYWPTGRIEDISLSAQVVGTDRTYGFPRICDQTPSIRVFPEKNRDSKEAVDKKADDSLVLHVKGKCFNATMTLTKHTERCPWCPDPREITVIGQEPAEQSGYHIIPKWSPFHDESVVYVGILVLAIIAIAASTAFAMILVTYTRYKKRVKESAKKARFHPYISVKGHEIEDQNRYDLPWEQHNRPLTYWMTSSNKSDSTMTSPLDSASSLSNHTHQHPEMFQSTYTRDGYQTYRPPPPPPPVAHPPVFPPQTQIYHPSRHLTSPLSSRQDDSGLESV
ncbi:unnamed protein product [Caenorhabditis bovis]|uniref:C2 domain-containing protein n=1 Tax=Caenorhabditis bovis TaxID=2654633 RepID=A0A8S1ES20_9PELO|nr:unnamed protein product [Caenorhabditis bovis]